MPIKAAIRWVIDAWNKPRTREYKFRMVEPLPPPPSPRPGERIIRRAASGEFGGMKEEFLVAEEAQRQVWIAEAAQARQHRYEEKIARILAGQID